MIVAAQGFILTNNHVVEGADEIAVMLPGGKVAEARVVGTDPETDLAVLRVDAKGLQPITFGDPASVQVGDIVLAVGDPFGVGQTVTQGIVSATGRNRLGISTFENVPGGPASRRIRHHRRQRRHRDCSLLPGPPPSPKYTITLLLGLARHLCEMPRQGIPGEILVSGARRPIPCADRPFVRHRAGCSEVDR